jgi:gas vesicle protein
MSRFDSTTFLTGVLFGCAVGAAAALLTAPQPGRALTALRSRRTFRAQEPMVDETIEESFPASDPPSWTPATSTTTVP